MTWTNTTSHNKYNKILRASRVVVGGVQIQPLWKRKYEWGTKYDVVYEMRVIKAQEVQSQCTNTTDTETVANKHDMFFKVRSIKMVQQQL